MAGTSVHWLRILFAFATVPILASCATNSVGQSLSDQLIPCWSFDPGLRDPDHYKVVVHVKFRRDGSIEEAKITDPDPLPADPRFRTYAEGTMRVFQNPGCVPVHFPNGQYLPEADFVFDLAKAINGGY